MGHIKSDAYYMGLVLDCASYSLDRSAKVGCVIIDDQGNLMTEGYNQVPMGCEHTEERHQRPAKYDWTEHAERNAIYNAAREGTALYGCTMYVNWYPCVPCARGILEIGIRRLVGIEPDWNDEMYGSDFATTREMLAEANIEVTFMDMELPR